MANSAVINTVYNHFLTTYAPKGTNTKYDAHKKSELRDVYNSMLKKNKDAPLFILDKSDETRQFAVGLKEDARDFKNTISSLSIDNSEGLLNQKAVASSDEGTVSASYIGNASSGEEIPELEISVNQLAQGQVNTGKFLEPDSMSLKEGTYSFDIHSRDLDYEFQFNIAEGDTNKSIQEKLSRLITKSNIGVTASVETDGNNNTALKLVSDDTGVKDESGLLFEVTDDKTSKTKGTVDYFGLNKVTESPQNSSFVLNGVQRSTFANTFTIDKTYELSLKDVSKEGTSVSIGPKTDLESLTENVTGLIEGYNSFMNKLSEYSSIQPGGGKLLREMKALSVPFKDDLSEIGVELGENGAISLNESKLIESATSIDATDKLSSLKRYAGAVLDKINQVALDPMEYTDKKIVQYKNPGHSLTTPYVTSNYSGMMFNSYC